MKLLFGLAVAIVAVNAAPTRHMVNDKFFVDAINNIPGIKWTAGMNDRFEGMSLEDSKSLLGVNGDWGEAVKKLKYEANAHIQAADIPDTFDSAKNWPHCAKVISDIRDQSNCGCCWAFGGVSAASDRMCIATNGSIAVPLSAEEVCFCSNQNGCGGGQIDTPWNYIAQAGAVTGGQQAFKGKGKDPDPFAGAGFCSDYSLPHCHHHGPVRNDPFPAEGAPGCPQQQSPSCPSKCDSGSNRTFEKDKYTFSGSTSGAQGEADIQRAIIAGGPVETAFTVYGDFANYASGIYHHTTGNMLGGHAVRIVGWGVDSGTKYWKVANSWNPYWGENGYFRIVRGTNECGIENGVSFAPSDAKWSKGGHPGPSPGPPGPPPPPPGQKCGQITCPPQGFTCCQGPQFSSCCPSGFKCNKKTGTCGL